jgi:Sulfotransferase family
MASRSAPADGRRYVFLASSPYSGSTLLSFLLASHPRVATISDVSGTRRTGQMDTFRCSCGERMRTCPFWSQLRDHAAGRGIPDLDLADFRLGFDAARHTWLRGIQARSLRWPRLEHLRDRALAPLGVADDMRAVAARNWALANAVMDMTDTNVFVDASKERLRIRYLDRYLPEPPRVIHLVRDVRGVVESTMRRAKRKDPAPAIAREWARTNESIGQQLHELPADRRLRIRYEDLCRDVDGTMQQAFAFMGVDPDAALQPMGHGQHMLGNQMRLATAADVRLDERWREALPEDLTRSILRSAEPIFGRLYPDASGAGSSSRA